MRLAADIRADEWWTYKLAPLLGTAYATAYFLGERLTDVAGVLLVALVALVAGSAYVSLLNDLTDRATDAAAGKPNQSAGRSGLQSAGLLAATVVAGWGPVLLLWSGRPLVLAAYAAPWVAFACYSLPPLRLKARGAAGAMADAAGAEVLPRLFVVAVLLEETPGNDHTVWVLLVLAWAVGLGLRGAILHQLRDADADLRSGVGTFAVRHPELAPRTGRFVAFPLEVAAFCALVVASGNVLGIVAIVLYAGFPWLSSQYHPMQVVVVGPPSGPYRVVMHELYVVLFPLAYLVAAAVRSPRDLVFLVGHVALFHRPILQAVQEARDGFYVVRREASPALVRAARSRTGA